MKSISNQIANLGGGFEPTQTAMSCNDMALMQAALDAGDLGIMVLDEEGDVRAWNKKFLEYFQRAGLAGNVDSAVDFFVVGQNLYNRWPALKKDALEARAKSGRVFELEHWPQEDRGELLLLRDITQKWLAEDTLHEATQQFDALSRAKQVFLSQVAHEFRTPLNIVLGYTGMMLEPQATARQVPEYVDWLNYIQEAAQGLLTNLNDMVELVQIEAGKRTLDIDDYESDQLVRQVAEDGSNLADQYGIELDNGAWLQPEQQFAARCDRVSVRKILRMLINFCIASCEPGETIRLMPLTQVGKRVIFEILSPCGKQEVDEIVRVYRENLPLAEVSLTGYASGYALALASAMARMQKSGVLVRKTREDSLRIRLSLPFAGPKPKQT